LFPATGEIRRCLFSPAGLLLLTLALLMSGCQAYAPRPLPLTVQWSNDAAVPIGPLTVDEVVRLALAKAYADGLPPDPTLSFSMDRPGAAGYIPGFMVGLDADQLNASRRHA